MQVLGGAEDGGLEKHVIELTHSLKQSGINISVIAHKKFKKDFNGVNFIELDLSKGRNNPFILYELYKILRQENFDIIHTQANKATNMIIKLKPFLKTKIVSTLHSYKRNIKSFEKSDFVITVSHKIGEKLKNKNKNKTTIYNGLSLNKIIKIDLHQKYNIKKDKFIICSVGRLVNVKRFDVLIQSIKNIDVHLILVGDGERRENLRSLSKKFSIENKITFTGELNANETQEIIKSSDLSIITSQREGFSYFFAESLSLNTPLISTDVADIKRSIGERYIIPFNNPEEIASKIEYVKSNYDTIYKDFNNGFEFAKNEFSIDTMVEKTINIYKGIIL
ncbi:MAG: glycosyltransferase family 4 protein [Campylobacteraceae bacterium]|nr:glycosyltransferase family 4 protein [Campylobacteraceae bacterium]